MRVGSLFSGIGGFDLGLERAGMEIAWQSEIDGFCNRVLAKRWPGVINHGDITALEPDALGPVDLVCGGFPCQDVSVAGRRAGLAGERSRLWFEFVRVVRALKPRWVLVENVPGLLSSHGGRDFAIVLRGLVKLGYGVAWRVLDAQFFGVPQRRRRVFIVGCLGDPAGAFEVLFEPESSPWNPPPSREAGANVAYAIAAGAGGSKFGSGRDGQDTFVTQALTGTFANGGADDTKAQGGFLVPVRKAARAREKDGEESWVEAVTANTLNTWDHGDIRSTNLVVHTLRAEGHDAGEDASTGRGTPLVIRTVGDYGNPSVKVDDIPFLAANPMSDRQMVVMDQRLAVRRLTPLECERLQGFPDGWTCLCEARGGTQACSCPDSPRYRALGNAVTVPVASWIGWRIVAVEAGLFDHARAEAR